MTNWLAYRDGIGQVRVNGGHAIVGGQQRHGMGYHHPVDVDIGDPGRGFGTLVSSPSVIASIALARRSTMGRAWAAAAARRA